tara:strand:+ start:176 stop:370 length:195 start_codon:yes stop_codon:yes gene_type:complete
MEVLIMNQHFFYLLQQLEQEEDKQEDRFELEYLYLYDSLPEYGRLEQKEEEVGPNDRGVIIIDI